MKRIILTALALGFAAATMLPSVAASASAKSPKPNTVSAGPAKGAAPTEAKGASTSDASKGAVSPAAVTDSLELLEHLVARDSSKFDILYRLGSLYLDRDRIPEALQVLGRARKLKPKDVGTLVNLGAANDANGSAELAQRYYHQALEISPDDSIATCRLASSLYAQAKYPDAMDLLRGLISTKPSSHCAYFTLGVAFADAGIYRDAIRMWKKVVELAPMSPEAASANESIDVLEKFIKTGE